MCLFYMCVVIYIPMVPGTWARGLLMLNQRLKLLFSTKLMAMLATSPLTLTDTLPSTPMVTTLTLMVPSTWARGVLMLSQRLMLLFCVELTVMLSPTHMDTLATSDTLPH